MSQRNGTQKSIVASAAAQRFLMRMIAATEFQSAVTVSGRIGFPTAWLRVARLMSFKTFARRCKVQRRRSSQGAFLRIRFCLEPGLRLPLSWS
jgi:hypothetical protein